MEEQLKPHVFLLQIWLQNHLFSLGLVILVHRRLFYDNLFQIIDIQDILIKQNTYVFDYQNFGCVVNKMA